MIFHKQISLPYRYIRHKPEAVWVKEVKQMEQLLQVVLQWSTSQQQLIVDGISTKCLEELQMIKMKTTFRYIKVQVHNTILTITFILPLIGYFSVDEPHQQSKLPNQLTATQCCPH